MTSDPMPGRRRVETQIPRRKKAPPKPPLTSEWHAELPPPPRLKMPAERLTKKSREKT